MIPYLHNYYWDGVAVGLVCGIILGWTLWRLPVHAARFMDQRKEKDHLEIQRILGFEQVPERTIEEIAKDPPAPAHTPRHSRVEETEWSLFRDDPKGWVVAHLPTPMTPEQVAEQTYQEIRWSETRQPMPSPTATSTGSFSTLTVERHAPWRGSTMRIGRAFTTARNARTSSTSVPSGLKSNTVT